jgi:predicted histone-like DNA-binding protein
MPIKFKVIERGEPGVTGGGTKKFYAKAVTGGEMTLDDMTRQIEKICTVSGADIRAVLYAMVDVSIDALANGTIIRVGDLGSLRMSISSEGREKSDDVSATAIRGGSVLFNPGPRIKSMLTGLKYQKMNGVPDAPPIKKK